MKIFVSFILGCTLFVSSLFGSQKVEQTVVLGSGPAGLTAAIYTSRAGLSTLVIEGDEPGGQITLSYTVENYPGFPEGIGGYELGEKMRGQAMRFGTRIEHGRVIKADLSSRPFKLTMEGGKEIHSETLIIATGASAKWLGLASEQALIGKGVGSCAVCDGALYKDKEVVVVGGGDAAMEDAIYLSQYAKKVSIVHRRDDLKASKVLQEKVQTKKNIRTILNSTIEEIKDPKNGEVTGVVLKDLKNDATKFYPCNGVFIAIGHKPNNALFQGQLKTTSAGYIEKKTSSTTTDIPGVFVAGDIADPMYRQAITAAGEGAKAGIDAFHFIQEFDKTKVTVEKEKNEEKVKERL